MTHKPHKIAKVKGNRMPNHIIFMDTETEKIPIDPPYEKNMLTLGVARYTRSRRGEILRTQSETIFSTPGEFWDWVERVQPDKTKFYLVTHNLEFDLPVVRAFHELPARGWELTQYYSSHYVSIFRWKRGKQHLIALDNANFFPYPLETLGNELGIPKGDYHSVAWSRDRLIEYCRNDVHIIHQAWIRWIEFMLNNDLGPFRYTLASTAFSAYRYRFMEHDIYIHTDPDVLELEYQAYRGARAEPYFTGERSGGRYWVLDYNSMYGAVMAKFGYPTRLRDTAENESIGFLKHQLKRGSVVADVVINTDEPAYPARHNHYTVYPVGRFQTVLTTPELMYAVKRGHVEEVRKIAWYRQEPLFGSYVNTLWDLRLGYQAENNRPFALNCKTLINGLYGKWGQRGIEQIQIGECDPEVVLQLRNYNMITHTSEEIVFMGGSIIRTLNEGYAYHAFPAIAAHVTAYARMTLYLAMKRIPKKHLFYVDTDSFMVDEVGYKALSPLIRPEVLGGLKIEAESSWIRINGLKDYELEGRVKLRGISRKAIQLSPNVYQQTSFLGLRGMLHRRDLDGHTSAVVQKTLKRQIRCGVVDSEGWIHPYRL